VGGVLKVDMTSLATALSDTIICCPYQALPAAAPLPKHDDAEEVTMQDADLSHMGQNAHGRGGAYDEDDDEEGRGGQRVQCAQQ
jgi:hypothetical protein